MKMYKMMLAALGACALLTGCELFQRCKCNTPECYPLCRIDRKDNRFLSENNWKKFKSFKPIKYRPVGLPLVDDMASIVSKLSIQISQKLVIPYVELDSEGLICAYNEYVTSVDNVMKQQKCDAKKASELVWADWAKYPGGKEKCIKLQRAIPLIQSLRAKAQFAQAMAQIEPEVNRLVTASFAYGVKWNQAKKGLKSRRGKEKLFRAGAQVVPNILHLSFAVSFLSALKVQQAEQVRAMEDYILSVQNFYEKPAK